MTGTIGVVKHSVRIAGHLTSVSLEAAFWQALGEIAVRRRVSVAALLSAIDAARTGNLSSAVRLFVLDSCRRGELPLGIDRGCPAGSIVPEYPLRPGMPRPRRGDGS